MGTRRIIDRLKDEVWECSDDLKDSLVLSSKGRGQEAITVLTRSMPKVRIALIKSISMTGALIDSKYLASAEQWRELSDKALALYDAMGKLLIRITEVEI